jgi:large subunit ribosomal protein L4
MPRTARREALLSALSLKNREGKIIVVDKFELDQAKTRFMVKALGDLNVQSAVILIAQPEEKIERSARNLPKVKVLRVNGVNVYDLLRYDHLIVTQDALRQLEERFAQ